MIFEAKTIGPNYATIRGKSLIFETTRQMYVISKSGLEWIDGSEWRADSDWDYIYISTLKIIDERKEGK